MGRASLYVSGSLGHGESLSPPGPLGPMNLSEYTLLSKCSDFSFLLIQIPPHAVPSYRLNISSFVARSFTEDLSFSIMQKNKSIPSQGTLVRPESLRQHGTLAKPGSFPMFVSITYSESISPRGPLAACVSLFISENSFCINGSLYFNKSFPFHVPILKHEYTLPRHVSFNLIQVSLS